MCTCAFSSPFFFSLSAAPGTRLQPRLDRRQCNFFAGQGRRTWAGAQQYCALRGGSLASVVNVEENEQVRQLLAELGDFASAGGWLGAHVDSTGDDFVWDDETPWRFFDYDNWQPHQPDITLGECVRMTLGAG